MVRFFLEKFQTSDPEIQTLSFCTVIRGQRFAISGIMPLDFFIFWVVCYLWHVLGASMHTTNDSWRLHVTCSVPSGACPHPTLLLPHFHVHTDRAVQVVASEAQTSTDNGLWLTSRMHLRLFKFWPERALYELAWMVHFYVAFSQHWNKKTCWD